MTASTPDVRRALVAVLIARTAINGSLRVVYPFLPAIARGLSTSLAVLGALLAARSAVSLLAPVAARVAERSGRRALLLFGTAAALAGSAIAAVAPSVAVLGVGLVVTGLAKPAFDPAMQGWFSSRVPYERRGRVLGITELSWALGLLVTVPLAGVLIARTSWRALFVVAAVLTAAGLVAVAVLVAPDRHAAPAAGRLRLTRPTVTMLAVVLAFSAAAEMLFVVYGAWLEVGLGLRVAAIGAFTLVVVLAELAGEGAVAAFGDRVGLKRTVFLGLAATTVAYVLLGTVGGALAAAVAVVVLWFVGFEVTIVASIPLTSELAPDGRDRLLSLSVATIALARSVGALAGPWLFARGGITLTGRVAAGLAVAAAVGLLTVPDPALESAREPRT